MKISETTSYPHPVLAPWSADVTGATIHAELTLREDGEAQQIDIHCETSLDQPDLIELIERGDAAFGCFITCIATGFRRLQRFGFPSGSHQFAPGALLGRVQFRPLVWATRPIPNYAPKGMHPEFGTPMDVEPGQILALDEELRVDVLRPPIPSIESIFEIFSSDDVEEGDFQIDMTGDRIEILVGERTYSLVQTLREGDAAAKSVAMNAVFVPVVMEVLHQLAEGSEQFEQCRWFAPFSKRCELLDVEMKSPELLTDAQVLLAKPFAGLSCLVDAEEIDDE